MKKYDELLNKREEILSEAESRLRACGLKPLVVSVNYRDPTSYDPVSFRIHYEGSITLDVLNKVSTAFGTRTLTIDCFIYGEDDYSMVLDIGCGAR